MTLMQAWIDSVQLLRPKNLQLFVMVTIKSIIEAYKLMFKYFWWLILLFELCYISLFFSMQSVKISLWLFQLLLFAVCAITRPSIVKKDYAYLRSQLFYFVYFAVILLCLPYTWWPTAFSALSIFWILFFLDSEKGPKNFLLSSWYALKMMLFNFPLILCIHAIMWIINAVIFGIINYVILGIATYWANAIPAIVNSIGFVQSIFMILLLPIGVCTYANIYIKKLHDQFDLYVKPQEMLKG